MHEDDVNLENIKILNHMGLEALKAIFLLNGGASIAFLTFIGTIAVKGQSNGISMPDLAHILFWFATGAGLVVAAFSFNYLIILFSAHGYEKTGSWLRFFTILAAAFSLIFFFVGVWSAIAIFSA